MIGKIVTFKIDLLLKTHWTNFELEIEHPSPSMSNVHKLYEMYACTCTSTCTKLNGMCAGFFDDTCIKRYRHL